MSGMPTEGVTSGALEASDINAVIIVIAPGMTSRDVIEEASVSSSNEIETVPA